jgi:glycosyltransferase involved in cell wall biosynthesis
MKSSMNYISVIITAYDRKEYLLQAINSTIKQSLSKDLYEIILIKNFRDDDIDTFANKNNIINLFSENNTLSGKIMEAMEKAKGNILCFLDDDDIFYYEKLEYVLKKFAGNINLCYLHNNFTAIDKDGKPLAYYNKNPDFNMSSISMRKKIINIETFGGISKSIDTLIYFYAKESKMEMEIDNIELTYYRVTDNSVTHSFTDLDSFIKFSYNSLKIILDSYNSMVSIFHSRDVLNNLQHKISFTRIRLYMFGGNRPGLHDYLTLLFTPAMESRSYEIKVALASIVFKKYTIAKLYKNEIIKGKAK